MAKLSLRLEKTPQKCEYCGADLTPENVYVEVINGVKHYFCCEHCAEAYKGNSTSHHCAC